MTNNKNYWVVEYRYAVTITDGETPEEAAEQASDVIKKELGFRPSNWNARVFEYGASTTVVGPLAEYFCNPHGTKFRKLDKNDEEHGRMFHEKLEKDNNDE
jgi:hypothetical protein